MLLEKISLFCVIIFYMEELIEKTNNLINNIDKLDQVKTIRFLNKKISKDKELSDLIHTYQFNHDENLKRRILDNKLFKEYKINETDINLLIMDINSRLKSINGNKGCK